MLHMSLVVRVTCRGTAHRGHSLRAVAQFRYDEGWARVHHQGERDLIRMEPSGDLSQRYRFECPRCSRVEVFKADKLYPLLDWAREHGTDNVPLG